MKNKKKLIILIILLLLFAIGLNYALKSRLFSENSAYEQDVDSNKKDISESNDDEKKDGMKKDISKNSDAKIKNDMKKNEVKDISKKQDFTKKGNTNKFDDNNFSKNEVENYTDIKVLRPGEFPIEYEGKIDSDVEKNSEREINNSNKTTLVENNGKLDKSNQNEKVNEDNLINSSDDTKEMDKKTEDTIDNPNKNDEIIGDTSPIENEDIDKENLQDILTIFTKNYRVNEGLVFSSKNKNMLPTNAYIGLKATGENDGKMHEISWSKEDLESIQNNIPGKYKMLVNVMDDLKIADKVYENVSFYVDVIIK